MSFRRKKKVGCNHTFDVVKTMVLQPSLVQELVCKDCRGRFVGMGGTEGHPEFIHMLPNSKPISIEKMRV